jgi:UDP-glucose 4-epimerase
VLGPERESWEENAMQTVLVTGGAGFIGSHLCEVLLAEGHRVLVLDDLSTGQRANVAHLDGDPRFALTVGSVCDREALGSLIARADAVFHLAAAVGVRLVVDSPVRTMETNVNGTEAVLAGAAAARVPVLIASSSEVYGRGVKVPFHEDDDLVLGNTRTGRWSYACSKALDEFLALAYWRERAVPAVVVRLFNTAGPRQSDRYGMVLPTFVRQALANQPLTVFGDGRQRRCFCAVSDVVAAMLRLLADSATAGQVFNIGSQEEVTITALAERVKRLTGSASPIVHIPYAEAWNDQFEDMQRRVPDLARLHAAIGFRPTKTLDEIIASVIAYESAKG